jgi:CubicO group peptidase (beta-lactamase class C family)
MMKIFLPVTLLLLSCAVHAQQNFSSLDQWLENNVQQLGGRAVLVVYKNGKPIYTKSENELTTRQKIMNRAIARRQGKPIHGAAQDMDENSRMPIASCSKWLTAALVMTFVDEGKLTINDPIGKYLPVMAANGKGGITIWQCLSHTTGIKQTGLGEQDESGDSGTGLDRFGKLKTLGAGKANTMDAVMDSIARIPMEGVPGKTFHYGNAGLQIAAAIIEKISGQSFEELFQQRIAKPCDMLHTDYGHKPVPLAAGGAWSTTTDYMHFLQMILDKGIYNGKRVLSAGSIAAMQKDYTKDANIVYSPVNAKSWDYGFGEWVMKDGATSKSNTVSSPGLFGSFPWIDNQKGYCAMLFTFNLKNKGREELYKSLKETVDKVITN